MAQPDHMEGTGEELQRHLQQHPNERFRLIRIVNGAAFEGAKTPARRKELSPEEELDLLDELCDLGRHLPASPEHETYSRETLYADHD